MGGRTRWAAVVLAVLLSAGPAAAAPGQQSTVGKYWYSFKEYWGGAFRSQGAVTLAVLGTGAVALFIITRGKWRK